MSRRKSRGIALPTVLLALLLLETLAAVALVGALAWARAARWTAAEARARGAHDTGLGVARAAPWLQSWDTATQRFAVESGRLPGGGMFFTWFSHWSSRVTAYIAQGASERTEARSVAAVMGIRRPLVPALDAAFISGGALDVDGTLVARGEPAADNEWAACGAPRGALAHRQLSGGDAVALFDSLPHDVWRPFALTGPGPVAGVVWPEPVVVGGTCAAEPWSNWGDPLEPLAPCGARWAIVYYDGALRIAGGRGQGALVVTGDLTVGGGFLFHGLVAVRGRLVVEEPGFSVVGTLLVGEVLGQRHAVRGTLAVQYSKCFVEMGLPGSGKPDRLPGPSWLQLTEVP